MNEKKDRRHFKSTSRIRTITDGFLILIAIGTLLLSMPFAKAGEGRADIISALFTATSASCVTGLSVVDTASYWSFGGRLIILMLIQVGGLGVMMMGAMAAMAVRKKITIGQRMLLSTSLNLDEVSGIVRLARTIILGTAMFEGIGAALLTLLFMRDFGFWGALERGIFISISAFCNAGFDNLGVGGDFASITAYGGSAPVLAVLAVLIIVGGIGFYVWNDTLEYIRGGRRLSLHSRIVLSTTAILLAGGTIGFLLTESRSSVACGSGLVRVVQCFFQSVTVRTAGFDHLGQGSLTSASRALGNILMFIGGSPGSVAGGVKTTTAAVIALSAVSSLYGRKRVTVFERTIPRSTIDQAYTLVMLAAIAATGGALTVSIIEGIEFDAALYECVSAVATVGLSTGITPGLGIFSQLLLVFLMFLGRVGLITVGMAALMKGQPDDSIRLPEGKVIIG